MAHDANKVVMGVVGSNLAEITCENGDPTDFPAGLAVRLGDDGALQLAADGVAVLIGVSLGESTLDEEKVSVCRDGNFIPLLVTPDAATLVVGDLTFTAVTPGVEGNEIQIELLDEMEDGSAVVEVVGTLISISIESGVTTAEDILAAIEADEDADALVTVAIAEGEDETAQVAAAAANLEDGGAPWIELGTAVKIDATTGKATADGTTTAAIYLSTELIGLYADGTTAPAAYIALPGGF